MPLNYIYWARSFVAVDDKIRQWIEGNLDKGYSSDSIKKRLKESGYDPALLDDVLLSRVPPSSMSVPPINKPSTFIPSSASVVHRDASGAAGTNRTSMGLLERFKDTLFYPKEYFESIKNEDDYRTPITYYFAFAFVPIVISILFSNSAGAITEIASRVIYSILFVVVVHAFVSLFGGKQGFVNTLKAFAYPTAVVFPITIFQIAALLLESASAAIVAVLVSLILGLYALQLELWAFERLQNIGQWRAFFAIIFSAGALTVAVFLLTYATIFKAL